MLLLNVILELLVFGIILTILYIISAIIFFRDEIESALERDPAATSAIEIILTYSGFHAIVLHRITHALYNAKIPFLPRFLSHVGKFITFRSPVAAFTGILEIVSEIAKVISFSFRLFGNIFAGEVLLTIIAFLIPYIAPLPFLGLELFVGFIQALIFATLAMVAFSSFTVAHEEYH